MKKLLSLALVLALMLSLGVSAFAEIYVDGESQGLIQEVLVDKAQCVSADAKGDYLKVFENVTGDSQGFANSVIAQNGAEITVGGEVTAELVWPGSAIQASNASTKVTVEGAVTEKTNGNAINASLGAAVEVGSVDEKNDGDAINASSGAVVEVGSVTEEGDGNAITADGAMVIVVGDVTEYGDGNAIKAKGTSKVIVGGDVKGDVSKNTINVYDNNAVVIVEGLVTGDIKNDGSEIYIGELNGDISDGKSNVHYLIGIATEGSAALSAVKLVSDIVAQGTIDGINEEGYRYTTTADTTALNGKTITLKPAEDGKILTVSGFNGANVTYVANEDGTVTFTIGDSFTGGLQNLVLVLANKPSPGPDPDPSPVIYVVPVGSITVVEFTAPEGIEEGLITKLDSADHAGLTLDKSLLAEGYDHSVKVTLNGEELPEGAYRFVINWDGSLSLILSTTYMKSLGNGSYDFLATIDGLEIPFTVAVAE